MRIRQSEFTAWRRCRRKWYFAYERDLRKQAPGTRRMPQSSYRDAGSAAHAGCAVIHEGGTLSEALTAVRAYVKETRSFRPEGTLLPALDSVSDPEWYGVLELALAMVEGYVEWLADTGQDAGYETLAVEEPFEFEMIDGTLVYGTWDLVGRDALLGGVVIDDLKSVASFTELHAIDFQLRTYALAHWRTSGERPVAGRHRQLRRVKRSGRAKPPFFDTRTIHFSEDALLAHEQHLMVQAREIGKARGVCYSDGPTSPYLYPNPTGDCVRWDCDFKAMCPMVDEGDDFEHVVELNFTVKSETTEGEALR